MKSVGKYLIINKIKVNQNPRDLIAKRLQILKVARMTLNVINPINK
jgi:hypothetical protein